MRSAARAATAAIVIVTLAGCSAANDSLAEQYRAGDGKNYVAGDGTITELAPADRGEPVSFTGTLETGEPVSSDDYAGRVLVVNFWYAGCAPCRAEAPDLEASWTRYKDQGVGFLGVNVRDQAGTALAFAETYGITYPSMIDANDGRAQLAFSGEVAPNAVPTTLVLDRQGRVASRILGRIQDAGILDALIDSTLEEQR